MPKSPKNYRKPVGRRAGGGQNATPSANWYHSNPFSRTLGSRILAEKKEEKREGRD